MNYEHIAHRIEDKPVCKWSLFKEEVRFMSCIHQCEQGLGHCTPPSFFSSLPVVKPMLLSFTKDWCVYNSKEEKKKKTSVECGSSYLHGVWLLFLSVCAGRRACVLRRVGLKTLRGVKATKELSSGGDSGTANMALTLIYASRWSEERKKVKERDLEGKCIDKGKWRQDRGTERIVV